MKQKKFPLDLLIISAATLLICLFSALSQMGLFDGTLFPLDRETFGFSLLIGLWGFVTTLILCVPLWVIYGYIRIAVLLHRKPRKTAFVLWLFLVPLITATLIAVCVFLYKITHMVVY